MIHDINFGTMDWEFVFRDRAHLAESYPEGTTGTKNVRLNGDLSPLLDTSRPRIAIIGTRDYTPQIAEQVNKILSLFTSLPEDKEPIIISGLAIGTNTAVHQAALRYGLSTFAVVATGFNTVYPAQNKTLAEKITKTFGCGIISQFPDDTEPSVINFLARNRTIALMSDILIIPATKEKGGATVTARIAHDWGIPVYAIPGSPENHRYAGCNELIRQGIAKILCRYDDLLNDI